MDDRVYIVHDEDSLVAVFATAELANAYVEEERRSSLYGHDFTVSARPLISKMPERVIRYAKRGQHEATARRVWEFEREGWFDSAEEALSS